MALLSWSFILIYSVFMSINIFPIAVSKSLKSQSNSDDYEIVNVTIGIEVTENFLRTGTVYYFGFPFVEDTYVRLTRVANLSFIAFGQLYEVVFDRNQTPSFFPMAEVHLNGTSRNSSFGINKLELHILEGYLKHDNETKVYGYVANNIFTGVIVYWNCTLFLEPVERYKQLDNKEHVFGETVVFRSKDIKPEFYGKRKEGANVNQNGSDICRWNENGVVVCSQGIWQTSETETNTTLVHSATQNTSKEGINFVHIKNSDRQLKNSSSDMICFVEVIADYPFFSSLKECIDSTVAEMLYYVKMSDAILKDVNFGSDNQSAVYVRFSVKNATIFTAPTDENNTEPESLVAYLERLGSRQQNYCLSIVFSGKRNPRDVLAVSTPDSHSRLRNGGICALQHGDGKNASFLAKNIGIITAVDASGKIQTSAMNSLLTGYLFRLSIGSGQRNSSCPVDEVLKSNTMRLTDLDGWRIRNKWFPQCSRETVKTFLQQRQDDCLTPLKSVCGNGIVELFEECDCGMKEECYSNRSCCTPPGGKGVDLGCTFRREMGRECDSRKPCCSDECHIIPAVASHFCADEGDKRCNQRFCDGVSPECPQAPMEKNGTLCRETGATCSSGYCNSTICRDQELEDCDCESAYECHTCCITKEGQCKTFSDTSQGRLYFKLPGTLCHSGNGICDESGKCFELFKSPSGQNRIIGLLVLNYIMACMAVFGAKYLQRQV